MNGLGLLLILGIVMYFLLSKNGGAGCCGGHSDHDSHHRIPDHGKKEQLSQDRENENIIDLKPEEYQVSSKRVR